MVCLNDNYAIIKHNEDFLFTMVSGRKVGKAASKRYSEIVV